MLDEQTLETLSELADELSIEVSKLLREKLQEHTFVFDTDDAFDEQTGVLMASTENEIGGRYPRLDPSYVEYFLNIKSDGELRDTLGDNILESTAAASLYSTRFGDDDSGEVCD